MGVYSTTLNGVNFSGLGLGEAAAAAKAKIIHQRILKRIMAYIDRLVYPKYEAINEGEIGETNSEIPDIVVWSLKRNAEHDEPLVAIEITTDEYEEDNIDKLKDLFAKYPTLKECFLFNYETPKHGKWLQVFNTSNTINNSKCFFIKHITGKECDFNAALENADIANLIGIKKKKRSK